MSRRAPVEIGLLLLGAAYLLIALGLFLVAGAIADALEPPAIAAPIVQSDFPLCVTVKPSPLLQPPPESNYEYRLDGARKDGGTA